MTGGKNTARRGFDIAALEDAANQDAERAAKKHGLIVPEKQASGAPEASRSTPQPAQKPEPAPKKKATNAGSNSGHRAYVYVGATTSLHAAAQEAFEAAPAGFRPESVTTVLSSFMSANDKQLASLLRKHYGLK